MRLLLIDDDEAFRNALARVCTRRNCTVMAVADGAAALACLDEFKPSHCVLDLRLANESGLNIIPALLACSSELKILMLTGYSSLATAVEAIKRGAINYLAKPVSADDILRAFGTLPADSASRARTEPEAEEGLLSVDRLAWEHIQRVLLEEAGNISSTARRLGMHRRTLQRRLMKRPVAQ